MNGGKDGYLGMITDISSRVAMEKDLKKTKKKLEIALDNGKIGTWEWDIRTNRVVWDRRMEEIFSLKPGTFGGELASFESYVHEEDLPHVKEAIRRSLYEGKPYEVVYRTRPFNGKSHYISSKALIMRSNKGNPLCLSGVAFDITDMKESAEKVLIKLNEELLRSNADLRQFAAIASHDLQEPLRMVSSYTQLLKQRYRDKLDQDAQDYINFAVDGSKRMYEMINGLLAYSRINIRESDFKCIDLNMILRKATDNLGLIIKERNAVVLTEKLPQVFADEIQMIQLFQNLIENSLKFSGTSPRVEISSEQAGSYYVIYVKDNGIGIEPQYFDKIFRIFQRLHTREEYTGAGIGLAICRRIVERHSGKIRVKSETGKGTTFIVSIPKK
jgi:PAS domain S-box-containing protein